MSTKVKTLKVNKSSNTRTVKIKELLTLSQGLAYINSKETKVWHYLRGQAPILLKLMNFGWGIHSILYKISYSITYISNFHIFLILNLTINHYRRA